VNSAAVEPCSIVLLFPLQEAACDPAEILMGPTIINQFFLLNQMIFDVAADKPHPQN